MKRAITLTLLMCLLCLTAFAQVTGVATLGFDHRFGHGATI